MNGLNSSQVNGMPAKVPRQAVGHNDGKLLYGLDQFYQKHRE
jgi:hypothetical protein